MLLRFLTLSAVVCLTQAMSCGPYKRVCGDDAECTDKKCRCKQGFVGFAPMVKCRKSHQFQCVLQADPHLTAFEGAAASLSFPCKYRLTRLQTPLQGGVPGLAFCSFEVFGFNEVINGMYFTSGVEISLAVGDFANQYFRQEDIIKFDIDVHGVQSSDGEATEWGQGVHSSFNGINVTCEFDIDQRFAILTIPRCNFEVRFRPFNPEEPSGPQSHVPAISIITGQDTIFGETELGRYPASLCGESDRQGDDSSLYNTRAMLLGLKNANQAVLYDALNQNLPQESVHKDRTDEVLQDSESCQAAVHQFQQCQSGANKCQAVELCSQVLTRKSVARCMGIEALRAFTACVQAVCGDRDLGCEGYNDALQNMNCKGPRKIKKFCKD